MAAYWEEDFSHLQDVLGSYPMIKRYIVLCLFFTHNELMSITQIGSELQNALARLMDAFPFLAGKVIYDGRDELKNRTGVSKIVPITSSPDLIINDLTNNSSFPGISGLRIARYPFSMLDPEILAPPIAVSWDSDGYDKTAPVFILQANFVRDHGLILAVSGNHTQMDMTGVGLVISLFSKACRNEPFTEEEIQLGNQPRGNVVPLLDNSYQPGPELDDSIRKPPDLSTPHPLPLDLTWSYFHFSSEHLKRLKSQASKQSITPYVSTDDAICALLWQRVASARSSYLGPNTETTFARAFSVRRWFNLHGYQGHMVDHLYDTQQDVHKEPLGNVAGRLRHLLGEDNKIIYHTQAYATMLSRLDDKTSIMNGAHLNPRRDIVISSYANVRCCELDFGSALGRPEAARRPRMAAWPSLLYLMPKDRDGGIALGICVGEEELAKLKRDEVLATFVEYIG